MRTRANHFSSWAQFICAAILANTMTYSSLTAGEPGSDFNSLSFSQAYWQGVRQLAAGEVDSAITSLEHAEMLDPEHTGTQIHLSRAYIYADRINEAEAAIEEVLETDSTNSAAYFVYGRVKQTRGEIDEAIAAYKTAIEMRKNNPFAHNNLGLLYLEEGQYEEAAALLEKAVEQKDDVGYFHNNLGMAYEAVREFDKARTSFEKALELDPGYDKAATNLTRVERLLGIEPIESGEFTNAENTAIDNDLEPTDEITSVLSNIEPETETDGLSTEFKWAEPEVAPQPDRQKIMHAGSIQNHQKGGVIVKLLGASSIAMVLAVAIFVRASRRDDYRSKI